MSNVSKCFSCARKNDYDPKFAYFGCKFSGLECKDYSMFEPKVKPKPITNYDRIRAMTDEELAVQIALPYLTSPPWCSEHTTCPYISEDPTPCDKCALDWLRKAVDE